MKNRSLSAHIKAMTIRTQKQNMWFVDKTRRNVQTGPKQWKLSGDFISGHELTWQAPSESKAVMFLFQFLVWPCRCYIKYCICQNLDAWSWQEPQSRVNAMDHYLRNLPDEWRRPPKQTENTLDRRDKRNIFCKETLFCWIISVPPRVGWYQGTHLFLDHLSTLLMRVIHHGCAPAVAVECKLWPWLGWVALFKEYCSLETFIVNSSKLLVLFLLCLRMQCGSNVIPLTVRESPTLVVRIV